MKTAKLLVLALSLFGFVANAQLEEGTSTTTSGSGMQEEPVRAPAKDKKKGKKAAKKKHGKKKAS